MSQQQQLPDLPPLPSTTTTTTATTTASKYPFTVLDDNTTISELTSVELPPYVEWIPTSKLRELVNSDTLQEGYILQQYATEMATIDERINTIRDEHKAYAGTLAVDHDTLLNRIHDTEEKLDGYFQLVRRFEDQKLEMYDVYRNLTRDAVAQRYQRELAVVERTCAELIDVERVESVDELDLLLQRYMSERIKWHEKKRIIDDLKSNKILN